MDELESANDIPDGVARIEALDNALKSCVPGEDAAKILDRAAQYYQFLTTNRAAGGGSTGVGWIIN